MALAEPSRNWLAALGVAAIAAALHAGTIGHGFVFDDGPEIVENAFVRSLTSAPRIFTTASWEGSGLAKEAPIWRPLTTLTYALNHAAGGLDPLGYHLVNVLLHALASMLVTWLALRLAVPLLGATAAGLLFAVMPVHVEAVANVAGRKEILATLFTIGAVLAHRSALRRGGAAMLLAPCLLAGGLLSKESGIAIVGVILAHDLFLGNGADRPPRRRLAGLYASYAVVVAAFLWGRYLVLGTLAFPGTPFLDNPVASAPVATRMMTAVAVVGRGLLLLVAPISLSADYSFAAIPPVTSPLDPAFLASLAAIGLIIAAAVAARHRFPLGLFAAAWYGITLLPASNLIVPIGTIFGERLLYLPSVAFALVVGAGVAALSRTRARRAAIAGATAVLLAYAARTWAYAGEWRDQLSLFTAAARAQPESSKAQRMLGGELLEAGRPLEARAAFERAVAVLSRAGAPVEEFSQPLVELGVAQERLGQLDEAERVLRRVLVAEPGYPDALWRLGVVRWRQGRTDEAVAIWRETVASNPRHAPALNDLGIAAFVSGDLASAESMWVRSTEANPRLPSAWYRLGNVREQKGDIAGARLAWTRFLEVAHEHPPEQRAEVARKLRSSGAAR